MASLPDLATVNFDVAGKSLWIHILKAEQAALEVAPNKAGPKYNDRLIGIRVLGFLLQDLWTHNRHSFGLIPYKNLITHIVSCLSIPGIAVGSEEEAEAQHEKLQALGLHYRNHLIRVCSSGIHSLPSCNLTFLQFVRMPAQFPNLPIILPVHPWTLFGTGSYAR